MPLTQYDYNLHPRPHLTKEDVCFYFMEHVSGGYTASPSNDKISNFKKPISVKGTNQWPYKQSAIKAFIADLASINFKDPQKEMMIVPGITSKPRSDTEWDDRIDKVSEGFAEQFSHLSIGKIIDTKDVMIPSSHGGSRDITIIKDNTIWDGNCPETADTIIIVDDVLTTGAHFKAWKEFILENCPKVNNVIGVFWALQGPFKILCQSGKINTTQGTTHEDRSRCRAICS